MDTIAVVGASLAGLNAAETLRRDGFEGRLVLIGDEADAAYDRPPLSKEVLAGRWDATRATLPIDVAALAADLRAGVAAVGLDAATRTVRLADGAEVVADGIVLATGASPRRLFDQDSLSGTFVVRSLADSLALRAALDAGARRVVVIGAGFIGAEVAATCRGNDHEVTLLEAAPWPLARVLGEPVGRVVAQLHRDHGVEVRLGVGVDGLVGDADGAVAGVRLAGGEVIAADVVVVGVGVTPNVAWLSGSGLDIDDGVVCDETLLAAPGITAAGDIVRWPSRRFAEHLRIEHWEHAIESGRAAARRLLAADRGEAPEPYDPVPWFWSDQYDRKVQLAGRAGADDEFAVVVGSLDEQRFAALYGRDGTVVGVLGMNRPRHVMQLRPLVERRAPWDEGLAAAAALT